jgi:protein XagA
MNKIFKPAFFFLLAFTPSVLSAQAWTKSKGTGFYKLDFATIRATDLLNGDGKLIPFNRTLANNVTSFYGEYGITDKVTAIAYVPFFVNNTFGKQPASAALLSLKYSNFGDADLGFRIQLPVKNIAMSANILFGLPTGASKHPDDLVTGDGEFNQMLKIAMGMGKTRWWTQGAVGFNNRTKGYSDEFRYDFEFGYKFLNDRLLTIFKINGVESFKNGTVAPTKTGLYSNNVVFAGVGPEILYFLNEKKSIGISARAAGSLRTLNILAAPSFSGGVFAQF